LSKDYLREGPFDVVGTAHAALSDAPISPSFFGLIRAEIIPTYNNFNELYIGDIAMAELLLKFRSSQRASRILIHEALVFQHYSPAIAYASSKAIPEDWLST
jgi:hypothetical protein